MKYNILWGFDQSSVFRIICTNCPYQSVCVAQFNNIQITKKYNNAKPCSFKLGEARNFLTHKKTSHKFTIISA